MKRATCLALFLVALASPARAQSWDISAMAGYVLPYDFSKVTRAVDTAGIGGGVSFSLGATYLLTPHWGAEVMWNAQPTGYELTVDGVAAELFAMTIHQVHGDLVYQFGDRGSRVHPFAFAGAGTTTFTAADIPMETHFSMAIGGGVKIYPWRNVGLRGQVRYRPTWLNDEDSAGFCDPFGFCQSMIRQLEVGGGITLRF